MGGHFNDASRGTYWIIGVSRYLASDLMSLVRF